MSFEYRDPRYQYDDDGNRRGTTPYGESEFAHRRSEPVAYASTPGLTERAIVAELTSWRSLLVWAAVAAIYYFTPLWELAFWRPSLLTPLAYAIPLLALAIAAPTAARFAFAGLGLVILAYAAYFWQRGNPRLLIPNLSMPWRQAQKIESALTECQKRLTGQPEGTHLGCYQTAVSAMEAEIQRLDGLILQQLNEGPHGKPAFLQDEQSWRQQSAKALIGVERAQHRNPKRELVLARERWNQLRGRAEFLAKNAMSFLDANRP